MAATTIGGDEVPMRPYEIMVILDPTLDERTVAPVAGDVPERHPE